MSDRPTISIYLHDHIVDFGYYRNWGGRSLLIESCELAKRLDGCTSYQEVQRRLGKFSEECDAPDCPQLSEGFEADNRVKKQMQMLSTLDRVGGHHPDEELMLEMESYSEFPIYIDLSRRCFYGGMVKVLSPCADWYPEGSPARYYHDPKFYADDVEVLDWRDWVKDDGGWYDQWASFGKAVSFDDADVILEWLDGDRSEGKDEAEAFKEAIELIAGLFDSAEPTQ